MKFGIEYERTNKASSIPAVLVGRWTIGMDLYEIMHDDRYYVFSEDISFQLIDNGETLVYGSRYKRLSGNPAEIYGVWTLENDPTEEWTLRSDNSYTYSFPGFVYVGFFTVSGTKLKTIEMRAVVSESGGILTFSPPYSAPMSGAWSLAGTALTIAFPTGDIVYTKA